MRPIADRYNLDQEAVLDNVLYSRAYTSEQQMELLDFVCAKFHEEPGVFKLLIVDSIMALFRVDYSGRGGIKIAFCLQSYFLYLNRAGGETAELGSDDVQAAEDLRGVQCGCHGDQSDDLGPRGNYVIPSRSEETHRFVMHTVINTVS